MKAPDLHSGYTWLWIGWFLYLIALETVALVRPEPGDTLTEQVRFLMLEHPIFTVVLAGLLAWLTYHFLVETFL